MGSSSLNDSFDLVLCVSGSAVTFFKFKQDKQKRKTKLKKKDSQFTIRDSEMGSSSLNDSFDSVLCVSGSRLVQSGLKDIELKDDMIMFVNAGGCEIQPQDSHLSLGGDSCFQGGDVIETNESMVEGGDHPSFYRSARFGNFCYKFDALPPGDYFIDLHFAEIINTNGPKGIRVFDVFVQDEKVLSEFDIYGIVGANKPLQLVDVRVSVEGGDSIMIRFEGKSGSPTVCGICIRRAPILMAPMVNCENPLCRKCATEVEALPTQTKAWSSKVIAKYEKKIEDLVKQCKLKSDECYQAWLSLSATNEELERLKIEHDNKLFHSENLELTIEQQKDKLRIISEQYEQDRKLWDAAIKDLEEKIKVMKQEHYVLSQEAHECANSIPDLSKMIDGVQTLVAQCEDLKLRYNEEVAKRKRLYNQVQESKGNIRVFCRYRPLTKEETLSRHMTVLDFEAAKDGDLGILSGGSSKRTFRFDRVYTPKDNQGK